MLSGISVSINARNQAMVANLFNNKYTDAKVGNVSVLFLKGPYVIPFNVKTGQNVILIFRGSLLSTTGWVDGSKDNISPHFIFANPLLLCKEVGRRKILDVSGVTDGSIFERNDTIPCLKILLNFGFDAYSFAIFSEPLKESAELSVSEFAKKFAILPDQPGWFNEGICWISWEYENFLSKPKDCNDISLHNI